MNHPIAKILVACGFLALVLAEAPRANAQDRPEVITARKARDQADIGSLRKVIDAARTEAQQHETAEAYERLAQFELWLCEAAHQHNEDKLIKQAAQNGVAAAEKAIALNPNSSEAHRLLGDALGELIPQVFGGGVRYGRRSSEALDKAIDLDPKNANAYIARGTAYFLAPSAFGGSRDKAVESLKKAIELEPSSDAAHIWLSQVYYAQGKPEEALREIKEARRLNPGRSFATHVYTQMTAETQERAHTK